MEEKKTIKAEYDAALWTGNGLNGVTKEVGISSVESGAVLFLMLLFSQNKPFIF